jgi:Fic family protein
VEVTRRTGHHAKGRQRKVLNKLFDRFEGKLTRDKWMKITRASSRTALRDIESLIGVGVLEQEKAGGRSTSYRLKVRAEATVELSTGPGSIRMV